MMSVFSKRWDHKSFMAMTVLLLLPVSFAGQAEWKSLPVQVPGTAHLELSGTFVNGQDLLDQVTERETQGEERVMEGAWFMSLVIENRSDAEILLSLDQSTIVMPDGSSHTLGKLSEGSFASFVLPGAHIEGSLSLPRSLYSPLGRITSSIVTGSLVKLYLSWQDSSGWHGEYWTWELVYESAVGRKIYINSLQGPYSSLMNELVSSWIHSLGGELTYRRDNAQFILDIEIAHASSRRRVNWWFLIFPAWPLAPLSVREAEVVILVSMVSSATGTSLLNNSFQGEAQQYFWGDLVSRNYVLTNAFRNAMEGIPNLPALASQ